MSYNDATLSIDVASLWEDFRQTKDSSVRDKLVENYLNLVKIVAGKIAIGLPQHVDKDDLISSGFMGLLDAVNKFDPARNIKFETYAVARIRGAILDSLRAQDWLPVAVRQKARQYEQVVGDLENKLGRSATDQEIAAEMGIGIEQLATLIRHLNASTLVPLEEFLQAETSSVDDGRESFQAIEENEVKKALATAIGKLPEKEQKVMALYYYEDMTLKEISLVMELSEARISQLHTKAVFRLRGALSRLKSSLV